MKNIITLILITLSISLSAQDFSLLSRSVVITNTSTIPTMWVQQVGVGMTYEKFGAEVVYIHTHTAQNGYGLYVTYQPWKKVISKKHKIGMGTKTIVELVQLWGDKNVSSIAIGQGFGFVKKFKDGSLSVTTIVDYKSLKINETISKSFIEVRGFIQGNYNL